MIHVIDQAVRIAHCETHFDICQILMALCLSLSLSELIIYFYMDINKTVE